MWEDSYNLISMQLSRASRLGAHRCDEYWERVRKGARNRSCRGGGKKNEQHWEEYSRLKESARDRTSRRGVRWHMVLGWRLSETRAYCESCCNISRVPKSKETNILSSRIQQEVYCRLMFNSGPCAISFTVQYSCTSKMWQRKGHDITHLSYISLERPSVELNINTANNTTFIHTTCVLWIGGILNSLVPLKHERVNLVSIPDQDLMKERARSSHGLRRVQ